MHTLPSNIVLMLLAAAALAVMILLIRWARKGGRGAGVLGSAMLLLLGMGLVVNPPQQRIEEAREDKGKKGGESGDPPASD